MTHIVTLQDLEAQREMTFGANWEPLVNHVGSVDADNYMYMGTHTTYNRNRIVRRCIYLYKHIDTKEYLNIDADGALYDYDAYTDQYHPKKEVANAS